MSDEITIMRNGRHVDRVPRREATVAKLVSGMLGREHAANFPDRAPLAPDAPVIFEATDFVREGAPPIDLRIRQGEVVGLFGLVGSGRSELAHALFGARRRSGGTVAIRGMEVDLRSPADAMAAGLALVPESRKDQGLFLGLTQERNAGMNGLKRHSSMGWLKSGLQREAAVRELERMGVEPVDPDRTVDVLSGGNQQKVLLAKTLMREPDVLVLDEPTRGVDVGARRAIYDIVADLVRDGMGVLLISSDFDEVSELSHRLLVMREGAIVAELASASATHDATLAAAFGVEHVPSSFMSEE